MASNSDGLFCKKCKKPIDQCTCPKQVIRFFGIAVVIFVTTFFGLPQLAAYAEDDQATSKILKQGSIICPSQEMLRQGLNKCVIAINSVNLPTPNPCDNYDECAKTDIEQKVTVLESIDSIIPGEDASKISYTSDGKSLEGWVSYHDLF